MAGTVRLRVWGEYGCFTRPEMKVERVSYDVMPPSAARGILEAIHWKPAISWRIDRIHVLAPIRFQSIRRNEVASRASAASAKTAMARSDLSGLGIDVAEDRQQRATIALYRPDYLIDAHIQLTSKATADETITKHAEMFQRRASRGQCFHHPCFGCREFAADFELWDGPAPSSSLADKDRNRDLGWMLYDIDYAAGNRPLFFRAALKDGVLDVSNVDPAEMAS